MTKDQIRIMCVDDHPVVREGLKAFISTEPDMIVVAETDTGEDAIELYRQHRPNIVLMDLGLSGINGLEATSVIRREFPNAKIIILSTSDGDEDIYRALDAGAQAYLLKESPDKDLIDVIRAVDLGQRRISGPVADRLAKHLPRVRLSERETEILRLIAQGLRNKEVGAQLKIAEDTVKAHIRNIFDKLNVNDRTLAVTVALQRGIIHLNQLLC